MMKKLLLLAALLLGCGSLKAQDLPVTASPADTLAPLNVYTVDSTLVGRSIFNLLPDQVKVHQSDAIRGAVLRRVSANEDKSVYGYRYPGRRHDIGNPAGYLETLKAFA